MGVPTAILHIFQFLAARLFGCAMCIGQRGVPIRRMRSSLIERQFEKYASITAIRPGFSAEMSADGGHCLLGGAEREGNLKSRMRGAHRLRRRRAKRALCAGHARRLGGASPLCNLMEVKH